MDIEGSEILALKGAERTIRRFKPKLAISIYHVFTHYFEAILFLHALNLGYRFHIEHYTSTAKKPSFMRWRKDRKKKTQKRSAFSSGNKKLASHLFAKMILRIVYNQIRNGSINPFITRKSVIKANPTARNKKTLYVTNVVANGFIRMLAVKEGDLALKIRSDRFKKEVESPL